MGAIGYEVADRVATITIDRPAKRNAMTYAVLAEFHEAVVAASGQGGLLVRVDPADADGLLASTAAVPMEMRGRPMRGWLRVASDEVATKRALARWVGIGTTYARSLPPKG